MRVSSIILVLATALQANCVAVFAELDTRQSAASNPDWTDNDRFRNFVLTKHNDFRKQHSANALKWDINLSAAAGKWLNSKGSGKNTCPNFAHSGGKYGENLAIGYSTPTISVQAWGNERNSYNFDKPGFNAKTGHFTQVVWRGTTHVGCARKYCTSSNVSKGWYLVCEYNPRGNILGQFDHHVKKGSFRGKRSLDAEAFVEERDAEAEPEAEAEAEAFDEINERGMIFFGEEEE